MNAAQHKRLTRYGKRRIARPRRHGTRSTVGTARLRRVRRDDGRGPARSLRCRRALLVRSPPRRRAEPSPRVLHHGWSTWLVARPTYRFALSSHQPPAGFHPACGLDIAGRLLARDQDASDPHVPLLLWWAVEAHALADLEDTLRRFTAPEAWQSAMCRSAILVRLIRRFAALKSCGR